MPYWGCLNVFANVIEKPFKAIINEFSGVESDDSPTGDVKYHFGAYLPGPHDPEKKYHSHLLATHPLITHKSGLQW